MDPRLYMLAGTFALLVIALGATIVSAIRASRRGRYVPDVEIDTQRDWPALPPVQEQEQGTSLDGFELDVPGDTPYAALLTPLRTGSWEPPEEPAPAASLSAVSLDARVASFEAASQTPDVPDLAVPPVAMEPLVDATLIPEIHLADMIASVEPMDELVLTQPSDMLLPELAPDAFRDAEPVTAVDTTVASWPPVAELVETAVPLVADLEEAPTPPVVDLEETPQPPVVDLEEATVPPVADLEAALPSPVPHFVDVPSVSVVETEEAALPAVPGWAALLPEVTDTVGVDGGFHLPLMPSEPLETELPPLPSVPSEVAQSTASTTAQPPVELSTPPDDALWESFFHAQVETPVEVVPSEETVTPTNVPPSPTSVAEAETVIDVPTLTEPTDSVEAVLEDARTLTEPAFEPVGITDSAPAVDLELPSVLPPTPDLAPQVALLPAPDLAPQVDLIPAPDPAPPIDLLPTPSIDSVSFPDFAAEVDAAPETPPARPRTIVRSIEPAMHDEPQEPTLEPLAPAPKPHTTVPARSEFVDMVMAAPVEIWIGDSRIGVKAGTRTYNQFRKYADVLFEDLAKSKS